MYIFHCIFINEVIVGGGVTGVLYIFAPPPHLIHVNRLVAAWNVLEFI